ncbi:MAG: 50S ribosomal protein L11 [Alphaproteobacteria bacterium]|nr:50S ribosomal protein L11 [Alphaproteobacteria bacterium]
MAKKITGVIRLEVPAGDAKPSGKVGPALGQRGLNIMEFCKAFNDKTADYDKGTPIPVAITAYEDRTFDFVTRKPTVSWYLKKAMNVDKGAKTAGREEFKSLSAEEIEHIAKEKQEDMCAESLEAAINTVAGSARSMGVRIR